MDMQPYKQDLRTRMRVARDALSLEKRNRLSALACWRIQEAASSLEARCVGLYRAIGSEIDLGPLAQTWGQRGIRLAVPVTLTDRRLSFVEVTASELSAPVGRDDGPPCSTDFLNRPWHPLPSLPDGRTPIAPEELDLLLVPGLAFDIRGGRLGYGGGYYDRYLSQTGLLAPRWGVCFEEQLLDRIPTDSLDIGMNAVATPLRTVATLP